MAEPDVSTLLPDWCATLQSALGVRGPAQFERRLPGRHQVWLLRVDGRELVLKATRAASEDSQLAEIRHRTICELAAGAAPVAEPLHEHPLELPGGWRGTVWARLDETSRAPTPAWSTRDGQALARLHRALDAAPGLDAGPLDSRELVATPVTVLAKHPSWTDAHSRLANSLAAWLDRLPREPEQWGLCHNDAHDLNILVDAAGQVRFIDFEFLAPSWRAYDIATWIWGTFRHSCGAPLWQAFLRAYALERPLSDQEAGWIRGLIVVRQLWWAALQARSGSDADLDDVLGFLITLAEQLGLDEIVDAEISCEPHL